MFFRDVHWLILVCLLSPGLTSPLVADIGHSTISLTNHLNTTNLTVPLCYPPSPGYQPKLIDCTAAVNNFRYVQDAFDLKLWTALSALRFRAKSRTCQVRLLPLSSYSEDIFALINVADTAAGIIAECLQWETGTTLGGRDQVGQRAVFQVVVERIVLPVM